MQEDENEFVDEISESEKRKTKLQELKKSRTLYFVAFAGFLIGAFFAFFSGKPALCGLFSGVAAMQLAAAGSIDTKINLILLYNRFVENKKD